MMKKIIIIIFFAATGLLLLASSCTKYGDGFLSPFVTYSIQQFAFVRGRVATSNALVTDGSSTPIQATMVHIYDSASGNLMDSVFFKKYPAYVWNASYNPKTDTTYSLIIAKRTLDSLPPITMNTSSGAISSTNTSLYLAKGAYFVDVQIHNSVGSEVLKRIMKLVITDGKQVEMEPEQGNLSNSLGFAGTSTSHLTIFNAVNNPFNRFTVTRLADTPNSIMLLFRDKNGLTFNPNKGEFGKRPNSGINPTPPFLQNLQDYAPDTYARTDSSISIRYPITPFPIASLGNGFNMYYDIESNAIHIDSTAAWTTNSPGNYYQGITDPRYLGQYQDGLYDYFIRVPMRVQVPGAYKIDVSILNITHN